MLLLTAGALSRERHGTSSTYHSLVDFLTAAADCTVHVSYVSLDCGSSCPLQVLAPFRQLSALQVGGFGEPQWRAACEEYNRRLAPVGSQLSAKLKDVFCSTIVPRLRAAVEGGQPQQVGSGESFACVFGSGLAGAVGVGGNVGKVLRGKNGGGLRRAQLGSLAVSCVSLVLRSIVVCCWG